MSQRVGKTHKLIFRGNIPLFFENRGVEKKEEIEDDKIRMRQEFVKELFCNPASMSGYVALIFIILYFLVNSLKL